MHLTNKREDFFEVEDIVEEFRVFLEEYGEDALDYVSIVGDGEPTLYAQIGELIQGLKGLTTKPVAIITNGSLLTLVEVREALLEADVVLPSLDAYDEESFKEINRPHGDLSYAEIIEGIRKFSEIYKGQLWVETMIIRGINDDQKSIMKLKAILDTIEYDRLYINSPIRDVAEPNVLCASRAALEYAREILGGILI